MKRFDRPALFILLTTLLSVAALMFLGMAMAQPAGADLPPAAVTAPILEAFPLVGLLLASALVLLTAAIVQPATQWIKTRLKRRFDDVRHWVIHGISLALSLGIGLLFLADGRLAADPVFGGIPWPWNVLIFGVAVFLRAGGVFDTDREAETVTVVNLSEGDFDEVD